MRIDPELAVALRRGEEAAAEPAGMPDTRELRASEAAVTGPNSSGARDRLYTKMARIADSMTERFGRGEEPINLGNASLVELLAFVSATEPSTPPRYARARDDETARAEPAHDHQGAASNTLI
jgi:hypothetical protein